MPYLIDGYNLLHALGLLTARMARHGLESARANLLQRLRASRAPEAADVTVVFDAAGAPPGAPPEADHGTVRFLFARGQTADDLIEDLIRRAPVPRGLTVVSDDHRVRRAATRRGCAVLGCVDYCERLTRTEQAPPAAEPPAKPDSSPEDTQRWLDVFGDDDDPSWREGY
jgi:predicted RNA-binding protein with PIN domain